MAFTKTIKNTENNLNLQSFRGEKKDIEERIGICHSIFLLKQYILNEYKGNYELFDNFYTNLLLSKIIFDVKPKNVLRKYFDASDKRLEIPEEVTADFPEIFKDDLKQSSDSRVYEKLKNDLNRLNFNPIQQKKTINKDETVYFDHSAEFFIFNTIFETHGFVDVLLNALNISADDAVYCDHNLVYLLRFCLKEKTYPAKIYINHNSINEFKYFLSYCFLNNIYFEKNHLPKIIILNPQKDTIPDNISVLLVKNESEYKLFSHSIDSSFRGLIRDIEISPFNKDLVEMLLSSNEMIAIFQHPVIEKSLFKELNGIFFQKKRKSANKVFNILQNYITKLSESKITSDQRQFLSITIESRIIKPKRSLQIDANKAFQNNEISTLENVRSIYEYFRTAPVFSAINIEDLNFVFSSFTSNESDNPALIEKVSKSRIPVFTSTIDTGASNDSRIEYSLFPVAMLNKHCILSAFFYRKDFLKFREILETDRCFFDQISEIIVGSDIEGIYKYNDKYFSNFNEYIPVISGECVSNANYIDITRINFFKRSDYQYNQVPFVEENDLIFRFKEDEETNVICTAIIPNILNNSLLGRDTFAVRLKDKTYDMNQISEYIKFLSDEGMMLQLTQLMNV